MSMSPCDITSNIKKLLTGQIQSIPLVVPSSVTLENFFRTVQVGTVGHTDAYSRLVCFRLSHIPHRFGLIRAFAE